MAYTNIDDPSAHFQALTYTGNGSNPRNLTNDGNSDLKPDLIWGKSRGTNIDHQLYDSSRGFGTSKGLQSNSTATESGQTTYGYISASLTDGFTAAAGGTNGDWFNRNNDPFVAWQWKANGGTTSSNTDGNITSTVQVNQDAGFSIVTYTGNGSNNQTIGHGLGVQPSWWVVKRRDSANDWFVGASSVLGGTSNYVRLNSGSANAESNNIWGDSPTSSTLFRVSNHAGLNASGGTYVAYLFANKQGFSKFGSYVGNGNSNGTFVYTGFKPAFVITKVTDDARDWRMWDAARDTFNVVEKYLTPNTTGAEGTTSTLNIDFLSNGFKLRGNHVSTNQSGKTFIYMAFAENPFVTSGGIPTTAR